MDKRPNGLIVVILLFFISLCIVGKCYMLSKIPFDIDKINAEIQPVQKDILLNSPVGFDSNNGDYYTYNNYTLYLVIKSIVTPKIFLYKKNTDTLLIVQYKKEKFKDFPNYRVICRSENNESIVSLITKLK